MKGSRMISLRGCNHQPKQKDGTDAAVTYPYDDASHNYSIR